jgi:TM2 domain-containing membrane protein YozV
MKDSHNKTESPEKKLTLVLLCWLFGCFGLHRFYTGKYLTGALMLVTLGGVCVWMIVDLALIIMGRFTDRDGLLIVEWV